jgi:hypothetical protein
VACGARGEGVRGTTKTMREKRDRIKGVERFSSNNQDYELNSTHSREYWWKRNVSIEIMRDVLEFSNMLCIIGYPSKISGVKTMGTNNKVLHTTRKLLIEVSDESELQHIYLMVFALVTLGFLYFIVLAHTFLCLFHQDP